MLMREGGGGCKSTRSGIRGRRMKARFYGRLCDATSLYVEMIGFECGRPSTERDCEVEEPDPVPIDLLRNICCGLPQPKAQRHTVPQGTGGGWLVVGGG